MRYFVIIVFLIGAFVAPYFLLGMQKASISPTEMPVASNTVFIKNYSFVPSVLTIKKGTTITWVNHDIARHTVRGDNATGLNSDFFGQNEKYSYTFNTVGVFAYHCEPHPYMKAKVVVTE